MSDPVRFLNAFAHALSAMTLYPEGHPTREHAVETPYQELEGLMGQGAQPTFTFLGDEVVYGSDRLKDLKDWDWGRRLSAAGIQRLEFERRLDRDEFESFLQEILARLTLSTLDTSEARQMRSLGVRFGSVGLQGLSDTLVDAGAHDVPPVEVGLADEADTLRWMQTEVQSTGRIPLLEAEAVVQSLSIAMHSDRHVVLPLLQLKEFDQYTTTHSLNVAVLSMALAEALGCSPREVRAYGVAGLLHDIGKIRVPVEILTKGGRLSAGERAVMRRHPVDGARLILESKEDLGMAAVVAYEHHVMLNGSGYPAFRYTRECTLASRLVHVCDVYDALRTRRPYRDAWPPKKTESYLEMRAGIEFDPALVDVFLTTLRQGELELKILGDQTA
jgi:putative nucleotidyltransferase with HDIG domain